MAAKSRRPGLPHGRRGRRHPSPAATPAFGDPRPDEADPWTPVPDPLGPLQKLRLRRFEACRGQARSSVPDHVQRAPDSPLGLIGKQMPVRIVSDLFRDQAAHHAAYEGQIGRLGHARRGQAIQELLQD